MEIREGLTFDDVLLVPRGGEFGRARPQLVERYRDGAGDVAFLVGVALADVDDRCAPLDRRNGVADGDLGDVRTLLELGGKEHPCDDQNAQDEAGRAEESGVFHTTTIGQAPPKYG